MKLVQEASTTATFLKRLRGHAVFRWYMQLTLSPIIDFRHLFNIEPKQSITKYQHIISFKMKYLFLIVLLAFRKYTFQTLNLCLFNIPLPSINQIQIVFFTNDIMQTAPFRRKCGFTFYSRTGSVNPSALLSFKIV